MPKQPLQSLQVVIDLGDFPDAVNRINLLARLQMPYEIEVYPTGDVSLTVTCDTFKFDVTLVHVNTRSLSERIAAVIMRMNPHIILDQLGDRNE